MKKSFAKKSVFVVSSIIALFIAFLFYTGSDYCYQSLDCRAIQDWDIWNMFNEDYVLPLFSFLPIFVFSLITYFTREEIFRAWWNFARWWIPLIMIGTILCGLMPSNHGFFNLDALIYLMVLAPLYGILMLGSLWKMGREYLKWYSISFKW